MNTQIAEFTTAYGEAMFYAHLIEDVVCRFAVLRLHFDQAALEIAAITSRLAYYRVLSVRMAMMQKASKAGLVTRRNGPFVGSAPRRTRTSDRRMRNPILYPAELWVPDFGQSSGAKRLQRSLVPQSPNVLESQNCEAKKNTGRSFASFGEKPT